MKKKEVILSNGTETSSTPAPRKNILIIIR